MGFAKANNQALKQASGRYVLFLNPDTIIPEDGLTTCISFMESHPDAGALGVRMIDGSGNFLRESKRGFPSPWASFCKMSGLTGFFPSSRLFARYYLGHLSENEQQVVDILSGAFMLVKKEVLDKTGGFDEQYFMYGEDIDLSYRIQQLGYKNYYLPDCIIIHFKGESTRKDSRYIKLFYKAMIQFVRKHFTGGLSGLYVGLLKMAIWMRSRRAKPGVEDQESAREIQFLVVTGDEISRGEVIKFISHNKIITNPADAEGIVFCEGGSFSFKQIILQLQSRSLNTKIFIHGSRTKCIVSSRSNKARGEIIPFE
jgi:hypothetical protein